MIDLLKIQTAVWALTAGTAAGLYSVRLYRKMPACWVCDDGEDLRTEHMPSMRIYLKMCIRDRLHGDKLRLLDGKIIQLGENQQKALFFFAVLFVDRTPHKFWTGLHIFKFTVSPEMKKRQIEGRRPSLRLLVEDVYKRQFTACADLRFCRRTENFVVFFPCPAPRFFR